MIFGSQLAQIKATPPGPQSQRLAAQMREFENRNITYVSKDFPIFLARAAGANVEDVDGNIYVDLTAFFGVAATGHSNPHVVGALAQQAGELLHGMGDVYPTENKVALAQKLCELMPGAGPKRVIFSSTGAEAVESALKTAAIATGKPGILCFTGAYHGLGYGALTVTDRDLFRAPFRRQLADISRRVPYPNCYRCPLKLTYPSCDVACLEFVRQALDEEENLEIGAIIVEPLQARGGCVPAPDRWLRALRKLCDERGLLLILDEVYSGFGRTGRWFDCEHAGISPDIMCVGKGLSSGFPISACIGKASVMDCWPESAGEAIHTSTFLGDPAGCAATLASIEQLREDKLVERSADLEAEMGELLSTLQKESNGRIGDVRGRGLMWGLECITENGEPDTALGLAVVRSCLKEGVLVLTSGPFANVIALSPPLVISIAQLQFGVDIIARALRGATK